MSNGPLWKMRDGLDPEPLRKAAKERATQAQQEQEQRTAEYDRKQKEGRAKAQSQAGPFRQRLSELLDTQVPAEAIKISSKHPGYEPTCYLGTIEETPDSDGSYVWTKRDLVATWHESELIHIRVQGEEDVQRRTLLSRGTYKTWDAGPVETSEDLLRIIEQRGNTRWTPPEDTPPAPEPEPAPPVSPAERAQALLEQLSNSPRNHRGLRGALIALAWSNLAGQD